MRLEPSNKFFIQSINRALLIIDAIAKNDQPGLTLTPLANKVDLPVSTVYRILQNLIAWQYVREDEHGVFSLGFELITLGNISKNSIELKNVARKYLTKLSDLTGETIYLSVLDEKRIEVMYVDKIESKGNIKLATGIGGRNDVHSTANGKILMSNFSEEKIRNLFKDKELIKRAENTITNIDEFIEVVESVKACGYAIDDIENEAGVRCIASPIKDYRKKVIGSISISGVTSNITLEKIESELKFLVMDTAAKISSELGYRE